MQFAHNSTIAVSDGRTLRLFRNSGNELHLNLQLDEDSYASATADLLNEKALSGEISSLYVVAPPRTLGELRRHYHAALKSKLLGELGKEHTHDTIDVLQRALVNA